MLVHETFFILLKCKLAFEKYREADFGWGTMLCKLLLLLRIPDFYLYFPAQAGCEDGTVNLYHTSSGELSPDTISSFVYFQLKRKW